MYRSHRQFAVLLALLAGTAGMPAIAAVGNSLAITNAGFEAQPLAPFTATDNVLTGWDIHDPLNGQTTTFQYGALNPSGSTYGTDTGYQSLSAPEGNNVAYLFCCVNNSYNAFAIQQTLSASLTANTQYNLSVQVGNEGSYSDFVALGGQDLTGFPGYKVELLAGNTVIGTDDNSVSISDGQFGTANVQVTFAAGNAALEAHAGEALTIRLWNKGSTSPTTAGYEVDFDNVAVSTLSGPTADAGGPYTYSAALLSATLDGTGSNDPDSDITGYTWKVGATTVGSGVSPALALINSGLTSTTDTGSVDLTVVDSTGFVSTDSAALAYQNTGPTVTDATGTEQPDLSMTFVANFDDADLIVNGIIAGFEALDIEISLSNIFGTGFITDVGTSILETLDRLTLEGILGGGTGIYTLYANVRDAAGATASLAFDIELTDGQPAPGPGRVPAPAAGALLLLGLAGLGAIRRRRS